MNAIDHPLVSAYLDAVTRETAGLPAERRAELLADLREHVEVSGAASDEQVREVLASLGDPRTVAASALAEEPLAAAPAAARPPRTRLTVVLLAVAGVLVLLNGFAGTAALIVGLALLWSSPVWSTRQKAIGTGACAAVPFVVVFGALALGGARIGPLELLIIATLSLVAPVVGATTLLRAARR